MERKLTYSIQTQSGAVIGGEANANGTVRIVEPLKNAVLASVRATVAIPATDATRIFMNGYQNWTYSPEYDRTGRTRGLKHLPPFLRGAFSINRYGDYHFADYPEKRGYLHGYSWMYFRDDDKYRFVGSLNEHTGYTRYLYIHQAH